MLQVGALYQCSGKIRHRSAPGDEHQALAEHVGLDWRTVKEIEKNHLSIKYKRIRLKDVRIIGIDEIYIGKGYKTIVRDLESGAVLFVGVGKGGDALVPFERKLRSSRCKIEVVAMDMSNAYSSWVKTHLWEAEIVFDLPACSTLTASTNAFRPMFGLTFPSSIIALSRDSLWGIAAMTASRSSKTDLI